MKQIAVLLALLLLSGCLTGCGSGAAEEPALCTYTVHCRSEAGDALEGVMLNFCTDSACSPVFSGASGEAVFSGAPDRYHVQVVRIPEGWELDGAAEWITEPCDQVFRISCREAGK